MRSSISLLLCFFLHFIMVGSPAAAEAQMPPSLPAEPAESSPVVADKEKTTALHKHPVSWGWGLGGHTFSTTDDVRQRRDFLEKLSRKFEGAYLLNVFAEWYAWETYGVGLRWLHFAGARTFQPLTHLTEFTLTDEVAVQTALLTAHWRPWISADGFTQVGTLVGLGPASYLVESTITCVGLFCSPAQQTAEQHTVAGTAALVGGHVDWGGDGFGVRFAINFLRTQFPKITSLREAGQHTTSVDASGVQLSFDFRWEIL